MNFITFINLYNDKSVAHKHHRVAKEATFPHKLRPCNILNGKLVQNFDTPL